MLIDDVRSKIAAKHYSGKTFDTYWHWIARYLKYHRRRNGGELSRGVDIRCMFDGLPI